MSLNNPESPLDDTVPDKEQYPMMREIVEDFEHYLSPSRTPNRNYTLTSPSQRFYIVDDHVYVGQSIAHELAARRHNPLHIITDDHDHPEAFISRRTNNTNDWALLHFLEESTTQEVIISISDISTLTTTAQNFLLDILENTTFNPESPAAQAYLETHNLDPDTFTTISGDPSKFIVLTSESGDDVLPDLSPDERTNFGVRVDPDAHDAYTNDAFTQL